MGRPLVFISAVAETALPSTRTRTVLTWHPTRSRMWAVCCVHFRTRCRFGFGLPCLWSIPLLYRDLHCRATAFIPSHSSAFFPFSESLHSLGGALIILLPHSILRTGHPCNHCVSLSILSSRPASAVRSAVGSAHAHVYRHQIRMALHLLAGTFVARGARWYGIHKLLVSLSSCSSLAYWSPMQLLRLTQYTEQPPGFGRVLGCGLGPCACVPSQNPDGFISPCGYICRKGLPDGAVYNSC